MHSELHKLVAAANISLFDADGAKHYCSGAPHIKHRTIAIFHRELVHQIYQYAVAYAGTPNVLDLGAGEGSVTLPFLELGARVTALDISAYQLEGLRKKCARFTDQLDIRCEDVREVIQAREQFYDVIVANGFLHHVPDYLDMIREAIRLLEPCGQFFSFQDPLRYDSMGKFDMFVSELAYSTWRIFQPDVIGGLQRRLRRARGIYESNSSFTNADYHVIRNGVDQDAITKLFEVEGFDCTIIRYFSTQSRVFQRLGSALGLKNTFAAIARRRKNRNTEMGG